MQYSSPFHENIILCYNKSLRQRNELIQVSGEVQEASISLKI